MESQFSFNPNPLVRYLQKPAEQFTREGLIKYVEKWYGKSPTVPDWACSHQVSCKRQGRSQSFSARIRPILLLQNKKKRKFSKRVYINYDSGNIHFMQ